MDFETIIENREILEDGLVLTLELALLGIVGSFIVGTLFGCFQTSQSYFLKKFADLYIEVMRNIPVLVKLFFLYFVVGMDAYPAAVISLVIHQSGFIADVVASGLRSVPREQMEAAFATGLRTVQCFLYVTLPQAIRIVIPPLTSQFIELTKNTSVVMLIGMQDLTFGSQNINVETYRYLESFIVVTVLYIAIMFTIVASMHGFRKALEQQ